MSKITCPKCNGTGKKGACSSCAGTGYGNNGGNCSKCGGSGKKTCVLCKGSGEVEDPR